MWPLMFSLWQHHFLTLSALWKEMKIVEMERGLPVFDIGLLNTFLPTGEITIWLLSKISIIYPSRKG